MVAKRSGLLRVVDVEEPVVDVDPVDHQVGKKATAEVPKPAPVAEPILIIGLVRRVNDKVFPGDLAGIDALRTALKTCRTAPVPGQMDLE
jgi:hypothetical protein